MIHRDPQTLTVEEAAAILRVSTNTLRRLLRQGKIPGVKVGNSWRISRKALDAFLAGSSSDSAPTRDNIDGQ